MLGRGKEVLISTREPVYAFTSKEPFRIEHKVPPTNLVLFKGFRKKRIIHIIDIMGSLDELTDLISFLAETRGTKKGEKVRDYLWKIWKFDEEKGEDFVV